MLNVVSLLVAAALVSLQYSLEADAQIDTKNNYDNNLNIARSRNPPTLRSFVKILQTPPKTVRHVPGTRLELQCSILAVPIPSVQWLKNGEVIVDYEEEANEVLPAPPETFVTVLATLVVTSSQDGDVFTCLASNGLHEKVASTTVFSAKDSLAYQVDEQVNEEEALMTLLQLTTMPTKPVITFTYTDILQNIGSDLLLPCRVMSLGETHLLWLDTQMRVIERNSRMKVLPSGDLLVRNLTFDDMGNYTCVAKNLFGKAVASTYVYPMLDKKQ